MSLVAGDHALFSIAARFCAFLDAGFKRVAQILRLLLGNRGSSLRLWATGCLRRICAAQQQSDAAQTPRKRSFI
jgi:hypothetical protein